MPIIDFHAHIFPNPIEKVIPQIPRLGPEGGDGGGRIVARGTPEDIGAHTVDGAPRVSGKILFGTLSSTVSGGGQTSFRDAAGRSAGGAQPVGPGQGATLRDASGRWQGSISGTTKSGPARPESSRKK